MPGGTNTGRSGCLTSASSLCPLGERNRICFRVCQWTAFHPTRRRSPQIPLRMGCGVAEQDCSGAVVCSGAHCIYQCAGASSHTSGTETFPAIPERHACAYLVGQHVNCFADKPPGRHQACTVAAGNSGSLDLNRFLGQPPGQCICQESGTR